MLPFELKIHHLTEGMQDAENYEIQHRFSHLQIFNPETRDQHPGSSIKKLRRLEDEKISVDPDQICRTAKLLNCCIAKWLNC